ncbi:hypothetical protein DICPUDRAFT_53209 [Dictyostelium purpureum]|uniref:Uncharacterized protein n=1 Tax=Dictyostelium purpureum TaxID=5786 RepID=F0ZBP0_DICPU|nr:uncharacterized protein DICPUDRAFT_53209 [Dictyostelium purpureum]EGC38629.1 hypothetical protein DICPUDRAFT_53209 [Dictyostelium purpureum]|eukprot:XP_003284822.1 hypothetical protein DICPUDRAFT_53209 [Dictyostelium purpureum]
MGSEENKKVNTTTTSFGNKIFLGVGGAFVGTIFGYALQRGNVYLPSVIQGQMNFSNFTMLKMFMTASLTSSLAVTFLNHRKLITIESLPVMYKRNLIGGLIMGSGIYLTGACPGTVLAQVPEIKGTLFTLLGGVVGATFYGYIDKIINKLFPAKNDDKPTLYQKLNVSMAKVTIPFALMLAGVLYTIESFFPWQSDSGVSPNTSILGSDSVWSPYRAGLTIGLLQIPTHLISKGGLGCSSAYVTIGSKVCNAFSCTVDYFKKFNSGSKAYFGPLLNAGIIFGAYLSSLSNPAPPLDAAGGSQTYLTHFLGGFILLIGARIANGCTSGHGLNSMAKMELGSFIAVASLFGGGILTSFLLNRK